jgi:protein-tyrosine kinase
MNALHSTIHNTSAAPFGAEVNAALPVIDIPGRDRAIDLAWDSAVAKSRGIYGFDSMDPRSRSFNLIRARLFELNAERGWRMIGICSATPNVGKSFISANVAASLSRDPRYQTYVVDLDLRRGSLSSQFGIIPEAGVRSFLENQPGADRPAVYGLEGERLLIMPTAAGQIRSAELLASERCQTLLRSMRASNPDTMYLFDLPPVFANDDAVTIMARLDAYVLIAEEGKTKERELDDAVGLLGGHKLAGVILNKYRGGLVSEGYGVDDYYAAGYASPDPEPSSD